MLNKRIHWLSALTIVSCLLSYCFSACKDPVRSNVLPLTQTHMVEIRNIDGRKIYLDSFPNRLIMQNDPENDETAFHSFKVGFEDSLKADPKAEKEIQKYIDYTMYKDWRVLSNGDSLLPVFSQPVVKKRDNLRESIIVFELPKGVAPDTLVYYDQFQPEKKNIIILSGK